MMPILLKSAGQLHYFPENSYGVDYGGFIKYNATM
jgi:hypothetical protein